jgi:hypothetical protein
MTTNFGIRQEESSFGTPVERLPATASADTWRGSTSCQRNDDGSRPRLIYSQSPMRRNYQGFQARISFESVPKRGVRPQAPLRTPSAILRDVDLGSTPEQIARLAEIHARVFGCPAQEVTAAIDATGRTLEHPLISAARRAPFAIVNCRCWPNGGWTDDRGNLDLAFVEGEMWNVVDFKTDADASLLQAQYGQLQWCLRALSCYAEPTHGWLLSV